MTDCPHPRHRVSDYADERPGSICMDCGEHLPGLPEAFRPKALPVLRDLLNTPEMLEMFP